MSPSVSLRFELPEFLPHLLCLITAFSVCQFWEIQKITPRAIEARPSPKGRCSANGTKALKYLGFVKNIIDTAVGFIPLLCLTRKLKSQSSFATAVKVNLLNPGPYLFWFTVGGNYIIRGSTAESLVFVVTALGTLIISKVAVAVLAVRFFLSLESHGYLLTMKFFAGTLVWFGLVSIVVILPPT
ncbi:hypothetical protein I8752_08575 [Nostocaceae cyanobacterium CENA369]|uniref:Uncharacterized protein n=1 Tax=Dendronalium phyllosphericum CENA369 TaxID=1725256 RepID=A0A8J7I3L9_9NOST|nr:hypothetical protein [Dendronalium phyllosphericum]MBH8573068.1 hypothetical protein [Dendronalium phyllosphericum CENA369]